MSDPTILLPFQPATMSAAHLAAVSYLARYSGRTHTLYAYQLREWFAWCESNGVDPLVGVQRAHVELYIRGLGDRGLMDSSVNTMMHAVRGYFRFAHIDGLIGSDPAVYARLPRIHRDESRTQGLDRLELIRFPQVAPYPHRPPRAPWHTCPATTPYARPKPQRCRSRNTPTPCADTGCCTWSARATNRPPCRSPSQCCALWRPAEVSGQPGRWCFDPCPASPSSDATSTAWSPGSRKQPPSHATSARTHCGTPASRALAIAACRWAAPRSWPDMLTPEPPSITTAHAATS